MGAGVVGVLGLTRGAAGPAGGAITRWTATGLGVGHYLVPLGLGAIGVALIWLRDRAPVLRVAGGVGIVVLSVAGLGHLAGGAPGASATHAQLRDAGGLGGRLVAEPVRSVLGPWGAVLVLVLAVVVSLLVLTGTTVRAIAAGAASGALGLGSRAVVLLRPVARALVQLFELPSRHEDGLSPTPDDESEDPAAEARGQHDEPAEDPRVAETPGPPVEPVEPAMPMPTETGPGQQLTIELGPSAAPGSWRLPPLNLLKRGKAAEIDRPQLQAGGRTLEAALRAHGVETRLVGMTVGPTVTRYELALGAGVKVARVTALHKDIAYAMASPDVRILAPIPGRSAIGVEVPNKQRQLVPLGDILASAEAKRASHPLEVALGRDIAGRPVMINLADMPHLLIAGATGSGKSSCINSLVTSILMRSTPEQVRLILVDPKRVELGQYNGLPHLLTQVVVNPKRAANALMWAVHEMERRYDLLAEVGVRDVTGYNAAFDRGELTSAGDLASDGDREYQRLPFVLVVVDELNDLMMVAARDVEDAVCRIAQMARAVGIHLVIATQRPSVDVITGVIKANIPSRLAFAVSSLADSRVILDQQGAERLIGQGDMLLLSASSNVARRVQGAWISEDEAHKVVAHWRRQSKPQYVDGVEGDDGLAGAADGRMGDDDDDELLDTAMELVVRSQLGSTSMLQRKLRVGFARAGRLMDLLERRGIVGPSEGSKARAVLMTPDELDGMRARAAQ